MAVETHIYDNKFFKNTIDLEKTSARSFIDILLKYYHPLSVVDIGCGAGIYLEELERRGWQDFLGIDGSPAAQEEFLADKSKLVIYDLSEKYNFSRSFDLCLCLELAEHLPASSADNLIETLISASDNIIFTAAVPGQGPRSIGHINEQPHQYWIDKFIKKNFLYLEDLSLKIRAEMAEREVVWWIVNNLMIFKKKLL